MFVNTTITLEPKTWTPITANAVTALAAENQGEFDILLMGTAGAVVPISDLGARILPPGAWLTTQYLLTEIWPGVSGVNYVYAWCNGRCKLAVSHG